MGAYSDRGDQGDLEPVGDERLRPSLMLAALFGGVVVTAGLTVLFVNSGLAGHPVVLMIGLSTIGAGVWVVLRAVLFRHVPRNWSIAAFAVLAPTSFALGCGCVAWQFLMMTRDRAALVEIDRAMFAERDPAAVVQLPAANGPMSAITRKAYGLMLGDRQRYQRAIEEAGIGDLSSPTALTAKGSLIEDCSRIDRVRKLSAEISARHILRLQGMRSAPQVDQIPAIVRPRFYRNLASGMDDAFRVAEAIHRSETKIIDAMGKSCSVLARRRWTMRDSQIMFTNDGDYVEFNALHWKIRGGAGRVRRMEQAQVEILRRLFQPLI